MLEEGVNLRESLNRRCGSARAAERALDRVRVDLGIGGSADNSPLVALALVAQGVPVDEVSKSLSWREFESFCASIARGEGYDVRENYTLTKPRSQIDMLVRSDSWLLTIDCKHWSRQGPGALSAMAAAQLRRSSNLRRLFANDSRPIFSSILTFHDLGRRFVDGAAVVPVFAFRSFLRSLEEVTGMLEAA